MDIFSTISNFLISTAHAENAAAAAAPGEAGGGFSMIIMLVIFVFFMYFVMWRPQAKRAKDHRNLIGSLAKGDEVVTAGGILGKITKISEQYAVVALADNVEITIQKSSIVNALPKGTLKSI